ncbi:MAG: hypothetical protein HYT31_03520 [Parcubacteria group bacterium]|nr:hypothetical protein [Parcubacteria group bacterium]
MPMMQEASETRECCGGSIPSRVQRTVWVPGPGGVQCEVQVSVCRVSDRMAQCAVQSDHRGTGAVSQVADAICTGLRQRTGNTVQSWETTVGERTFAGAIQVTLAGGDASLQEWLDALLNELGLLPDTGAASES